MLKSIIEDQGYKLSENAKTFVSLMNNSLMTNSNTQSIPFIIEQLGNKELLAVQKEIVDMNLFEFSLRRNFATVSVNTDTIESWGYDLEEIVFAYKLNKYSLKNLDAEEHIPMVKNKRNYSEPMFNRKALSDAHDFNFKFDVDKIKVSGDNDNP